MASKKSNQKELRWRDVVHRQADSGLSIREFCTKEGVSQASFYAWRRKLQERRRVKRQPRSLGRAVDKSVNGREFVPLAVLDAANVLEVVHPLGYRVRVTGGVDMHALQRVLDALDRRSNQ